MKIVYKIGNLLTSPEKLLIHGCNAKGVMGSGVAKAIRNNYPYAYDSYRSKFLKEGLFLGEVIFVDCQDKIIANAITQEFYGYGGKRYVDYDSINTAMKSVNEYAKTYGISHVAMPFIGSGLGGGSWKMISKIIENSFIDIIPVVYTLDGNIPLS